MPKSISFNTFGYFNLEKTKRGANTIMKYLKKHLNYLILVIIFGIINAFSLMMAFSQLGIIVDIATKQAQGNIIYISMYAVLYIILTFISSYLMTKFSLNYSNYQSNDLREKMLISMYRTSNADYYEKESDYYINILDEDIDNLRLNYFFPIPNIIIHLARIIFFGVALYQIHYLIFLLSIVFSLVPMFVGKIFVKPMKIRTSTMSKSNEKYLKYLKEMVFGYATIKGTNRYSKFIAKFVEVLNDRTKKKDNLNLMREIAQDTMFVVVMLGTIFIVTTGGYLVSKNFILVGDLVAAMVIISNLTEDISNFIEYFISIKSSKILLEKVETNILDSSCDDEIKVLSQPLIFNNLGLYFDEKKLFENINIAIQANQSVVIIGSSGSGKSSLIKTIMKYNLHYSGSIKFDKNDLKTINEKSIYNSINYIPQDVYILKDTFFNNIAMYNENVIESSKEYIDIIKKVNLYELYTRLKDENTINPQKLSGGEKQRIAIARALVSKASMIIFDEPTSALDPENKKLIEDLIFNLDGITKIVVSHKWDENYLNRFDQVIRL